MTTDSNKAVVERYFEMWNTGEVAVADEILAVEYVDYAHPEVKGTSSVNQSVLRVRTIDPTFHIAIEFLIAEGDLVALRGRVQRTQQGQSIVSHVLWFVRVRDGKMIELWTGTKSAR